MMCIFMSSICIAVAWASRFGARPQLLPAEGDDTLRRRAAGSERADQGPAGGRCRLSTFSLPSIQLSVPLHVAAASPARLHMLPGPQKQHVYVLGHRGKPSCGTRAHAPGKGGQLAQKEQVSGQEQAGVGQEEALVALAHAVCHHGAVVVEPLHTPATLSPLHSPFTALCAKRAGLSGKGLFLAHTVAHALAVVVEPLHTPASRRPLHSPFTASSC